MRFVILDVFTDRPLAGNQLAVVMDAERLDEALLQPIAAEFGFSETVFVYPPTRPDADARGRIFTPRAEISFAGHPTLGTALALGLERGIERVALELAVGIVPVELDGLAGWMIQPLPTAWPFPRPERLFEALGVAGSRLPVEVYDTGDPHVHVVVESVEQVLALEPDLRALVSLSAEVPHVDWSCCAGEGGNWTTRVFAPDDGIPEDAATGSAAGPLAWHLVRHGVVASGTELRISQGSVIGRPSTILARAQGAGDVPERIEVGGSAVVVAEGHLRLPAG
jgi:trans-2,3-dihydro-3-hydroxyanthranilate isomerase